MRGEILEECDDDLFNADDAGETDYALKESIRKMTRKFCVGVGLVQSSALTSLSKTHRS